MVDVATFLKNSLIVSLTVLVLQYLVIVPAAYAFARCKFRFKGFFFGIVLLGFMIPQQVTFIPIYLMFSKAGLLHEPDSPNSSVYLQRVWNLPAPAVFYADPGGDY